MDDRELKKRGRLSSEAITSAEDQTHVKITAISEKSISPHHKPQEDPDTPPELSLEDDLDEKKDCFDMTSMDEALGEDFSTKRRLRTKS